MDNCLVKTVCRIILLVFILFLSSSSFPLTASAQETTRDDSALSEVSNNTANDSGDNAAGNAGDDTAGNAGDNAAGNAGDDTAGNAGDNAAGNDSGDNTAGNDSGDNTADNHASGEIQNAEAAEAILKMMKGDNDTNENSTPAVNDTGAWNHIIIPWEDNPYDITAAVGAEKGHILDVWAVFQHRMNHWYRMGAALEFGFLSFLDNPTLMSRMMWTHEFDCSRGPTFSLTIFASIGFSYIRTKHKLSSLFGYQEDKSLYTFSYYNIALVLGLGFNWRITQGISIRLVLNLSSDFAVNSDCNRDNESGDVMDMLMYAIPMPGIKLGVTFHL